MGVIVRKEYICDFCGKVVREDAVVGRLSLRNAGARGMGRNLTVALHEACSQKLTRHAAPMKRERKAKQPA